jgi:hypothetical protein
MSVILEKTMTIESIVVGIFHLFDSNEKSKLNIFACNE